MNYRFIFASRLLIVQYLIFRQDSLAQFSISLDGSTRFEG